MLMKIHAHFNGHVASVLAVFMIVCLSLLHVAPALAESNASLVIAKTLGSGAQGEPADTQARFKAVRLIDVPGDATTDLGKLAQDNPRLLSSDPGVRTDPPQFADTDAEGKAAFFNLEPGVYQISEVNQAVGNEYRDIATPILVYVGHKTAFIRSKNQPTVIGKKANTDTATQGSDVVFHITTSVPPRDANGQLHQYVVVDALDSRLKLVGIRNVRINNVQGRVELREGEHFTVDAVNNRVVFSMNKTGLSKLAQSRDGNPDTSVRFDILTTVDKNLQEWSPIRNTELFSPDGYCVPQPDQTQTDAADYRLTADVEQHDGTLSPLDCRVGRAPEKSNTVEVGVKKEGDHNGSSSSQLWWPFAALLAALGLGSSSSSGGSSQPPSNDSPSAEPTTQQPNGKATTSPSESSGSTSKPGPLRQAIDSLASTGASVIGFILAGLTLIALAIVFLTRRRDSEDAILEVDDSDSQAGEKP